MSGSSGGFNAEDIRLCYRYLKEVESLPTGIAKSRFREASQEDKQTILARAKAWDGTLPATGGRLRKRKKSYAKPERVCFVEPAISFSALTTHIAGGQ